MKIQQTTKKNISQGKVTPLGATVEQGGVNFAIYSRFAKEIYLLLFNKPDKPPTDIILMDKSDQDVWTTFVKGIRPGQLYGYKVNGTYNPHEGMRFNPYKLLIDPYAKALTCACKNTDNLLLAYNAEHPDKDLVRDERDNTHIAPKSVVIDNTFNWQGDKSPNIPLEKLIIYEVHLKGFTAHKSSQVKNPGTYLGFIEKIPHLKKLGINAVELLPIHEFYERDGLINNGLNEYWGYNSIGFFAPESSYSTGKSFDSPVTEFKTLVKELHKAGIEVILDVVYNHTGEGNELGPTLCFRGVDNSSYYALEGEGDSPYRHYINITGCGNTFNVENPIAMKLVLDSLRYWAQEMHVDGFRFDLASALARAHGEYDKDSVFLKAIAKDPILKKVKIIAEPWDLSTYQVGNFPKGWSEWNGKFRDTARKFIKGDAGQAKELSLRLTGSADLYGDDGRSPYNSINFITCHDGFTLSDLYSYNDKHNEANKEENRDGTDENHGWNCGIEGETNDELITTLRLQMIKNAMCCLLIPLGTPMILGGDEFLRTQHGNNNAYCQDNELTWFNWDLVKKNQHMVNFVKNLIAFRKAHTILQKRKFLAGQDLDFDNVPDIQWFGENLDPVDWDNPELKTFCCQLDGSEEPSPLGNYHLFFILNADFNEHRILLPGYDQMPWYRVIDTSLKAGEDIQEKGKEILLKDQSQYVVHPRTVVGLLGK